MSIEYGIKEAKAALRKRMRRARVSFPNEFRIKETAAAADALRALEEFRTANTVAAYSASWGEIDPAPLFREKRILLPRCIGDGIMEFADIDGMRPGRYGNPEPWGGPPIPADEIDMILVPGLAFSHKCERLGMGAGFYDRYLPQLRPGCTIVGLGFSIQLMESIPVWGGDVRMDIVVCGGTVVRAAESKTV